MDAYFPFDITLDLSSLWHNLLRSQLLPLRSASYHYWFDLSIDKGIPYGVIAYLIFVNLRRFSRPFPPGSAWLLTVVLACAIESGKLFFAGRAFHADNIAIASLGALLGIILLPQFCAIISVKRHRETMWFVLLLAAVAYFELSPFDWIGLSALPGRFSKIEWLPFKCPDRLAIKNSVER